MQICKRCVYDSTIPGITFDENGVCNYCRLHDELEKQYPSGKEGERILLRTFKQIKDNGKGKKYDCVVGISGGCDSSFLLYKMKEYGLRPLAAHFDNTWNSAIACKNMANMLRKLDVDLFTYVVDNKEYNDICRSFLMAGVPDVEIPTDIGLAAVLNMAAEKYKVNYVIEGHSFRTEGISPLGWTYMDGKYIESVQKKYGDLPGLKTFPNMKLFRFLKWMIVSKIKKIRPLWYINHNKEETKKLLSRVLDWEWYGGHHLENRFTAFYHSYYLPQRWGIDKRKNGYSALIRSGQMEREEALALLEKPHYVPPEVIELVKQRLGFSDEEFEEIMNGPKHIFTDFKTYKRTFELMRPFFWLMYRLNYVPHSFYIKYCKKFPVEYLEEKKREG